MDEMEGRRLRPDEVCNAYAVDPQDGEVVNPAANAAPSYRFKIDDEAIPALWLDMRHELEVLAAPRVLPEAVLNALHKMFLCVLLDLSEHIFEAVALPTVGAEHSVLGVRISRACKGLMARCALDLLDISGHGSTPATVGFAHKP